MKRLIIITALALIYCAITTAQVTKQSQQQSLKQTSIQTLDQVQKQDRIQDGSGLLTHSKTKVSREERKLMKTKKIAVRKANHGKVVSETAKSTEPGPGKGEVVSAQAKTRGQAQQIRIKENNSAKNQSVFQNGHGNAMQNRTRVPIRGGTGRK